MKRNSGLKRIVSVFLVLLMMFTAVPASVFVIDADAYVMPDPIDYLDSDDQRIDMDFDKEWKFHLGDVNMGFGSDINDVSWDDVNLPHDFSIKQDFTTEGTEGESGNMPGGIGWYRKTFSLPSKLNGKRIIINFDGAYKDTYVYVNNEYVGENHYGYNSFAFDITEYLTINGEYVNYIAVKVESQIPSSRWYSGAGINRDVTLTAVDPVHVAHNGVDLSTMTADDFEGYEGQEAGLALANVSIRNDTNASKSVYVSAQILNMNGEAVGAEASNSLPLTVSANSTREITSDQVSAMTVAPELWSPESPNLYIFRVKVYDMADDLLDQYDTVFGFRTVEWDKDNGFYLNGQNIKLKGVCMHHDQGALGAVQTYDAIYRQVKMLKDMGCNAIRTSHGCPSAVYLQVCNELGMLVMDEFFDGWAVNKNSNSNDFGKNCNHLVTTSLITSYDYSNENLLGAKENDKWYQFVTRETVKRDRNNPCVVVWDLGNELWGTDTSNETMAQDMIDILQANDSEYESRLCCVGNNSGGRTGWDVQPLFPIIGANYGLPGTINELTGQVSGGWAGENGRDPAKPFVGTETASTVSSRGVYDKNASQTSSNSTTATHGNASFSYLTDFEIASYDVSHPHWGSTAADAWSFVATTEWNAGEFVWTGFDYIGEPTPWNPTTGPNANNIPNSSYFGIIDTAGFPKDNYYLYRSLWNETSNTLHVVPGTWVRSELGNKSNVPVAVYANGNVIKRVEVYLNNNSTPIGVSTATARTAGFYTYYTWEVTSGNGTTITNSNSHNLYPAFNIPYQAGKLTVKGYDAAGHEVTDTVGTTTVTSNTTVNNLAKIKTDVVTCDSKEVVADGDSYIYVEYTAVDENGDTILGYNDTIEVSLEGSTADCEITGVDNGNQATVNKFQNSHVFPDGNRQKARVEFYHGKALVIVRCLNHIEPGIMRLAQVSDDGIQIAEGATVRIKPDDIKDEFEEICPQGEVIYSNNSLDDTRSSYLNAAQNLDTSDFDLGNEEEVEPGFYKYTPVEDGDGRFIANGVYAIFCPQPDSKRTQYNDPDNATMKNITMSKGFSPAINCTVSNNKLNLPGGTSNDDVKFRFTYAGTENEYYIQPAAGVNEGKYLTLIDNDNAGLSDTPVKLKITISDGKVLIYSIHSATNENQYLDFYEQPTGHPFSSYRNNPANGNDKFDLYKWVENKRTDYQAYVPNTTAGQQAIENGKYVVRATKIDKILSIPSGSATNVPLLARGNSNFTTAGDILTLSDSANAVLTFTCANKESNLYTISYKTDSGTKYLKINDSDAPSFVSGRTVLKITTDPAYPGFILIGRESGGPFAGAASGQTQLTAGSGTLTIAGDEYYRFALYRERVYYQSELSQDGNKEIYSFYEGDQTSNVPVVEGWYALMGYAKKGSYTVYDHPTQDERSQAYGYLCSDRFSKTQDPRLSYTPGTTSIPATGNNLAKYAWYFERWDLSDSYIGYRVSTYVDGVRKYIQFSGGAHINLVLDKDQATRLDVFVPTANNSGYKADYISNNHSNAVIIKRCQSSNDYLHYTNTTADNGKWYGEVKHFSDNDKETLFELHRVDLQITDSTENNHLERYTDETIVEGDYVIAGRNSHSYKDKVYAEGGNVKMEDNGSNVDPLTLTNIQSKYIWHLTGNTTSIRNKDNGKYVVWAQPNSGGTIALPAMADNDNAYTTSFKFQRRSHNGSYHYIIYNSNYTSDKKNYLNPAGNSNRIQIWNADNDGDNGNNFVLYKVVPNKIVSVTVHREIQKTFFKPAIATGTSYIIANDLDSQKALSTSYEYSYASAADTILNMAEKTVITENSNEYTITQANQYENAYYIQAKNGKYVDLSSGLYLTDSPAVVYAKLTKDDNNHYFCFASSEEDLESSNGRVLLYNSSNNSFMRTQKFNSNIERMNLYHDSVPYYTAPSANQSSDKGDLYNTLLRVLAEYPQGRSEADYKKMLDYARECGIALREGNRTAEEYAQMNANLGYMYDNLGLAVKTYSGALFKYGYDASATGTARYLGNGGYDYNLQTIQEMKDFILNNDGYLKQIRALKKNGTNTVWTEGLSDEQKAEGVDKIAEYYARLYSLQFNAPGVTGISNSDKKDTIDGYNTAWNWWTKKYCWDPSRSEEYDKDDGASILGLFSLQLGEDGTPDTHDLYDFTQPGMPSFSGLKYTNVTARTGGSAGVTQNKTITVQTGVEVELTPLNNIAPYVPRFFTHENVQTGLSTELASIGATGTGLTPTSPNDENVYSKYHWDTQIPFTVTREANGSERYIYDSADANYLFRAYYDDDTATCMLQRTENTDWKLHINSKVDARGFYPFNFQLDSPDGDNKTTFPTENAIYHFGMSFGGSFLMPSSGDNFGDDIMFNFSGDDDVLVYVDGHLLLNNGGLHGARTVSINFTQRSVTYQYAFDIESNSVISPISGTGNNERAAMNVEYKYGNDSINRANGITDGIQAGIDYLHSIYGDGQEHTFNFFYLERGSTDSNCKIDFNLPQTDKLVREDEHTHVIDYGQTITHEVDVLDFQRKINTTAAPKFLGVITEDYETRKPLIGDTEAQVLQKLNYKFDQTGELNIEGKYGSFWFNNQGESEYKVKTMNFDNAASAYIVLEFQVVDPIKGFDTYYCVEKITYLPATTIYYEDSFEEGNANGITYTGNWTTVGNEVVNKLTADIAGDRSMRLYGANDEYPVSATYSSGAAHKVRVDKSTGNNFPAAQFTFSGTGFDVISMTSNETGVFVVSVYEGEGTTGNRVEYQLVDTYYGYAYGPLYLDNHGKPTLEATDKPLYLSYITKAEYDALSDANKNKYIISTFCSDIYTTQQEGGASQAKGWVKDGSKKNNSIYQVPVIKIENLPYGTYTAKIEARYTPIFGHGANGYDLYLDAIRIYDPAGVANVETPDADKQEVHNAYAADNENHAKFTQIKDMLIGAETLNNNEHSQEGIIFIDGNDAIETSDLDKYKQIGPNHELYLDGSTNSIAFEIWATAVPEDIQIGAKVAQGSAVQLEVTNEYNPSSSKTKKTITTATDMFYSLDTLLDEPIAWKLQQDKDGNWYYTSGTIVISNAAEKGNILSITNIKWTFGKYGATGEYRIPDLGPTNTNSGVADDEPMIVFAVNEAIERKAMRMMAAPEDVQISADGVSVAKSEVVAGEETIINITTPADMEKVIITDAKGRTVTPAALESKIEELDGKQVKQWTVVVVNNIPGEYTYYVTGEYEDGYNGGGAPIAVKVNVSAPVIDDPDIDNDNNDGGATAIKGLFARIRDFFRRIIEFIKNLGK